MVCILIISTAVSVSANNLIQPFWIHADSYDLSITYNGNSATCKVSIYGKSSTTKITSCNVYLKDSSGNTVKSWTGNSATGDTLLFEKSTTGVSSGKSYTLSFTATVYRNGETENISGSTTKTY